MMTWRIEGTVFEPTQGKVLPIGPVVVEAGGPNEFELAVALAKILLEYDVRTINVRKWNMTCAP